MKLFFMKAVIEMSGDEFTNDVFDRIKSLIVNHKHATVRISIDESKSFSERETKEEYFARLDKSIKQAEEGEVVTFTWDEFEAYTKQMLAEP